MLIAQYLRDYVFIIPLLVLFLAEVAKVVVEGVKSGRWHEPLFRPGGMPSSHSAFVTSLIIVVWHRTGAQSVEFAIAFVFACIVWYDAMSSRRALGEQAAILNRLQDWKKLTERLGHSFLQVLCGIAFGAVLTHAGVLIGRNF